TVKEKQELLKLALDWSETEKVTVSESPLVRDSVKNRIKSRNGSIESYLRDSGSLAKNRLLSRADVLALAEIEIAYEGYVKRHHEQIARLKEHESKEIPIDFNFLTLSSISNEASEVFSKVRPRTIGQATRLPGVTPTDAAILMSAIRVKQSVPRGTI
ncbi:MAG TPA: hypothetical protein VGM92_03815, partial [Candidatus Kapabacteria bacterium]